MPPDGNLSPSVGEFPAPGELILDVRPSEVFRAGHLPGSVNIPVPSGPNAQAAAEEFLPSVLLPPSRAALWVIDDEPDRLKGVLKSLRHRQRGSVRGVLFPALRRGSFRELELEQGPAAGHLWRPDPWLLRHAGLLPPPVAGPALDLACGSGRTAVWLAMRGFAVTGVDHLPDALDLGSRLAAFHQVSCEFVTADLRNPAGVPAGPWGVVTVFRYLQRDLLGRIAGLLQPGGVILVRTFLDRPGTTGQPAQRHRLRCGELPGYFPAPDFTVLAYEESLDPDGRPAAGIVVRRRR